MRVLHVTEASASGTLVAVQTLCERLADDGHDVAFAYGRRPETPPGLALSLPPAIECVALPWARRSPRAHVAAARALRALVRAWSPDVVHLHSAFAGVVGAATLCRSDVPLVYTPHGSPLGRTLDGRAHLAAYTRMEAFVARRVALVGAVSHAEAALVASAAPGARIEVVPNGIAELDGAPPGMPTRPRTGVVAMGRVVRQRRPSETAEILRAVSAQADVSWIGDGTAADTAPVRAAGVPITGWLPRTQALDRLAAASVLVHWSASDGAPLVVLEAFARDVVVVASDIPANRELLGSAQTCGRAADAIALVCAVLADRSLRDALLTRQRARRARYGAAAMAARWTALYRSLLAPERSTARASPAGSDHGADVVSWT
jgi:glycosyltransferase involved in cell wall biosynthesis